MEGERPSGAYPSRVEVERGSRRRRGRQTGCLDSPVSSTSSVPQPKRERRRHERLQARRGPESEVPLSLPTGVALAASQDASQVSPQTGASRRGQLSSAGPSSVSSRQRSVCAAENRAKDGENGEEKSAASSRKRKIADVALKDTEDVARVTPARRSALVGAASQRRKAAKRAARGEVSARRRCRRNGVEAGGHGAEEDEGEDGEHRDGGAEDRQDSRKRSSGDEGANAAEGDKLLSEDGGEDGLPLLPSGLPSLLSVPRATQRKAGEAVSSSSPCSRKAASVSVGNGEAPGDGAQASPEPDTGRECELTSESGSSGSGSSRRTRSSRRRKQEEMEEGSGGETQAAALESLEEVQSDEPQRQLPRRGLRRRQPALAEKGTDGQGEGELEKSERWLQTADVPELPCQAKKGRRGVSGEEAIDAGPNNQERVKSATHDAPAASRPAPLPSVAARPSAAPCVFSNEPFCSPCVCSPVSLYNSPMAGHAPSPAAGPPSLGFPSPRRSHFFEPVCTGGRGRWRPGADSVSQCTPQTSFRKGDRSRGVGRVQRAGAYESPRSMPNGADPGRSDTGPLEGSRSAGHPPAGRKETLRRRRSPSPCARPANVALSRRGSESSALSGSALIAVTVSSFQHLPPPLSPFKGPPRPGAAEAERRRRRRQRREEVQPEGSLRAEEARGRETSKASAPSGEVRTCAGKPGETVDDFSDDLSSPCLPYSREEEEEKALFPHPRRQALKHACSSARSSLSRLSSSSWRGAFSPSAVGLGPPDVWGASPCASDSNFFDASGRISASFSPFPSSPCSASVLWGSTSPTLLGAGSAGSYFGQSLSLDSSTSSQVSTSSASSSVVFAQPVLVRRGDRGRSRDSFVAGSGDGDSDGSQAPPRRSLQKKGRKHSSTATRTSTGGCVFRPPRLTSRGGRVGGVASVFNPPETGPAAVPTSVSGIGAAGVTTPCPRHFSLLPSLSRSGFLLTGSAIPNSSGAAAALSSQNPSSSAVPRNPLASDNMLLAASWGVSFHRTNARAGGATSGSLLGSTASGATGGAIPQSSPLVRRARRLSEGDAGDIGEDGEAVGTAARPGGGTVPASGGDVRRDRECGVSSGRNLETEEGDEGQREGRRSGDGAESKRKTGVSGLGKKEGKKGNRADPRDKKAANLSVSPKGSREKGRNAAGGRAGVAREAPHSAGKENVASWAGVEA
ncbi:conserved hypothetical protein [Neospora caninum Liverpool]|uniref:Uncharacterized protein n=1 Tax=Neospora caninum (strain Liverpool) TaxID=572307 RepID=F0VFV4_NEOCL|nr:conserved hypothetical protein [Neospora caninum Liverpool]CBZ52598.1 conserved hypothetical protein [Neospora caninum Liverpool]CEL66576.1 TPA: hypothetical protein BN1204_023870 [Neospora caninum Liverpool]|eukprot:XP_003882630.1 conserved hypothetical protein [Neospora caninum Liverpool]